MLIQIKGLDKSKQMEGGMFQKVFVRGKNTEQYRTKILYRLTFVGSIFLAAIAILPVIFTKLGNLPPSAQIGGTSMLIVIGVALEHNEAARKPTGKTPLQRVYQAMSKWEEWSSLHAHVLLRGNKDELNFNRASWCW